MAGYKSAGPGNATITSGGQLALSFAASAVDAGDWAAAHVCHRNATTAPEVPAGWEILGAGPFLVPPPPDSPVVARHWLIGKTDPLAGTEDGTSVNFGTAATTTVRHGRIYTFEAAGGGVITDHLTGLVHVGGPGGDSTVTDAGVTTTEDDALALNFVYIVNNYLGLPAFSGETGGDWLLLVSQYDTDLGLDGVQQLQGAILLTPGTINGGSYTIGGEDPWGNIGAELIDTAEAGTTGTLAGTLPALTGSLAGGAASDGVLAGTLPALIGQLAGAASLDADIVGVLPALSGDLSGVASADGAIAGTLPALSGDLAGAASSDGVVAGVLPALTGALAGTADLGRLTAVLPALTGDMVGVAAADGTVTGVLPALAGDLVGTVELPVGSDVQLWVGRLELRTRTGALTPRYSVGDLEAEP